ncbi:MAG: hypothetical protein R3C45_00645 [Phycisphaerales bacterium]
MSVDIHHQQQAMDRMDLAKSAYDSRQYDRALSHIRRAVELDPQNVNARVLQARIYLAEPAESGDVGVEGTGKDRTRYDQRARRWRCCAAERSPPAGSTGRAWAVASAR